MSTTLIYYACAGIAVWYAVVIFGYVWLVDRPKHDKHNSNNDNAVNDVIDQFELWNDKLETKQAALDFYYQLNEVCNHLFHNPLKLMITHEEFNNMTLSAIKKLNKEALDTLRSQINDQSFN